MLKKFINIDENFMVIKLFILKKRKTFFNEIGGYKAAPAEGS